MEFPKFKEQVKAGRLAAGYFLKGFSAAEASKVIEMMENGEFPVDDAVTKEIPLPRAGEALSDWCAAPRGVVKIMVTVA